MSPPDSSPSATGTPSRRERRQRALARRLGAPYEAAVPSGHLVMLDRPDTVALAVLHPGQEAA